MDRSSRCRAVTGPAPCDSLPTRLRRSRRVLVLVINSVGATDLLNPEAKNFSFGADLRLNEVSSGKGDDNGDNVLQRGLFSDANQYKLQVDKRVPSCTVKSGRAQLFVKFDKGLDEGWFRVRCAYEAGSLTLSVSRILTDRVEELGNKTDRSRSGRSASAPAHRQRSAASSDQTVSSS